MWTLLESVDLDRKLATAVVDPYCTLGEGQLEADHSHLCLCQPVVYGLSCSAAYGILPHQGSNPCVLHWQQILQHWAAREALLLSYNLSRMYFLKWLIVNICSRITVTKLSWIWVLRSFRNLSPVLTLLRTYLFCFLVTKIIALSSLDCFLLSTPRVLRNNQTQIALQTF